MLTIRITLAACVCISTVSLAANENRSSGLASSQRISALIDQLGHPKFAVREAAQEQLMRMGTQAFDSLYEARDSDEIEIRMRARYLVRSTKVEWATEDDPKPVRQALKDYQNRPESLRLQLIYKVAELDAVNPLCRIVRFEPSEVLSKFAALALIQRKFANEDELFARTATILTNVRHSRRRGADWLRHFASEGDPIEKALQWSSIVDEEIELLTSDPDKTNRVLAQNLAKSNADRLISLELPKEGKAAMRRVMDAHDGKSRRRLIELADWLLERQAWELVIEQSKRFSTVFQAEPLLMYRQAEALQRDQQKVEAEAIATKAFELPASRSLRGTIPYDTHVSRGLYLEERGLLPWCKREYQKAIEISNIIDYERHFARFRLSEILHDQSDDQLAADMLDQVLKEINENRQARSMVRQVLKREPKTIEARMNYFRAQALAQSGNGEESREYLEKGFRSDPTDPDVLIAMYRSPDAPEAWRQKTSERIRHAGELIQKRIKRLQSLEPSELDEDVRRNLANANNHYAWLVSNTEGDYQAALESSKKSLELVPGSPELTDTLARCYYALKDYENALRFQREAAKKLPHSLQIRRQLELFEKAYKDSHPN